MIVGGSRSNLLGALAVAAAGVALLVAAPLLPRSFANGQVTPPRIAEGALPKLELSISVRAMMMLGNIRDAALERGLLFRSAGDLFPAMIYDGGRRQKVTLRLKGDFVDHFKTDKWSWRVHVKNGGQVRGMRRFSLQAPNTRGYHWESLFMQHLRDEGVLAPRYEFVRLELNGMDIGVMALEEHFSKELLEAQGRKEGVILRFDEDEFWRDRSRNDQLLGVGKPSTSHDLSWRDARIRPFRASAIEKSPALQRQSRLGIGLLRALQSGTARASEVMDVDITGKWLAISEVWGLWHGLRWHNMRFYLNPYTLKLEPVGFDASSAPPVRGFVVTNPNVVFARVLLSDPLIYDSYRRHLGRITRREHLDRTLKKLDALETRIVAQIRPEYPNVSRSIRNQIERRAKRVFGESAIYPSSKRIRDTAKTGRETDIVQGHIPFTAAAYGQVVLQEDGQSVLELYTGLKEDVRVVELSVRTLRGERPLAEFAAIELPVVLAASYFDTAKRTVRIPIPEILAENPDRIQGKVSVPSDPGGEYAFTAVRYQPVSTAPLMPERGRVEDLLRAHHFLRWDGEGFFVPPGQHVVSTALVIPARLAVDGGEVNRPTLRLEAGVELSFQPDALLLTWGDLAAMGTVEKPVILSGVGGSTWRGVAVLGDGARVLLRHTRIQQTRHARYGPWELTGGVTFYQADVTLENVVFGGSQAEDALNLVRSTFVMRNVELHDTRSDALDSDFSEGTLEHCVFSRIGGDGIDLSGSTVTASDIEIRHVHDKALSIGEDSRFDAERLVIAGAGAGVVSKDGSQAMVSDIAISQVELAAFMSYSKKPVYGPASLQVEGAEVEEGTTLGIVQRGSTLVVDGEVVEPVDLDVGALYAGAVMGL